MSSAIQSRHWLGLALVASLAFNAGVGATVGVRTYHRFTGPDEPGELAAHPRDHRGRRSVHLHQQLGLTQAQIEELHSMRDDMFDEIHALRGALRDENRTLTDLIVTSETDREAIDVQLGRIASLRREIDDRVVEHFLSVKQKLNPDQYEAFNVLISRAFVRGVPGGPGPDGEHRFRRGAGKGMRGRYHGGEHFDRRRQER